jgi:hypothetical protein
MPAKPLSDRLVILFGLVLLVLASLACGSTTTDELRDASVAVQEENAPIEAAQESQTGDSAGEPEIADPQETNVPDTEPTAEATAVPTELPAIEALPLTIIDQGFGQEEQNAAYAFKVQNPNEAIGFENVGYQIAIKNSEGEIIGTDSGFITALFPNQVLGLAGTLFLDDGQIISSLDVQLSQGEEVATEPLETFTVDGTQFLSGDFSNEVAGIITSHFNRPFDDVRVSAITYDDAGKINGGGFTFASFIPANDGVGINVSVTSTGQVANVELFPVISILSLLGSDDEVPAGALSLELLDFGFGADDFGTSYGILVRNPNESFSLEASKYIVTAFDEAGTVVATDSGYLDVVLPGQDMGIGGSLFAQSNSAITSVKVHIRDGSFVESDVITGFTAEGVTFVPGDFSSEVTGNINNPYTSEITSLRVSALAFNEQGEITGGGFTYLDFIPAQGASPVSVQLSTVEPPASVQLYAATSSLSEFNN